jgi:hypothetical protein
MTQAQFIQEAKKNNSKIAKEIMVLQGGVTEKCNKNEWIKKQINKK